MANDFLLPAPIGDTAAGDRAAAARPFCGGGDICGDIETSPRPGITAHDFLLAPLIDRCENMFGKMVNDW